MAALQSPFYGDKMTLFSLCQKIERCEYPPLPNMFSQELQDLIDSMIVAEPNNRPDIDVIQKIAKKNYEALVKQSEEKK